MAAPFFFCSTCCWQHLLGLGAGEWKAQRLNSRHKFEQSRHHWGSQVPGSNVHTRGQAKRRLLSETSAICSKQPENPSSTNCPRQTTPGLHGVTMRCQHQHHLKTRHSALIFSMPVVGHPSRHACKFLEKNTQLLFEGSLAPRGTVPRLAATPASRSTQAVTWR